MRGTRGWILGLVLLAGLLLGWGPGATAQSAERYFYETSHTVRGRFLQYWENHGGLAQQGYPISDEFPEVSTTDGKTYTVQYFERAVFEYHPELAGTPYEVLLSLVGVDAYRQKYPQGAPDQRPHPAGRLFPETGKRLGGSFATYWDSHGGLPQQGYPISDEFTEMSVLDGKPYTVQYFERAVFEYHPENKGTPYEVLLAQLGTYRLAERYQGHPPGGSGLALPTPRPDYRQDSPRSSDRLLAWIETRYENNGPPTASAVMVYDFQTGQTGLVAEGAGLREGVAVDGAVVVWEEHPFGAQESALYAKDVAAGVRYAVSEGPGRHHAAAVAGRTVAWLAVADGTQRLLVRELGGGPATEVARAAAPRSPDWLEPGETQFIAPAISEAYLVWGEISAQAGNPNTTYQARLRVQERRTGQIRTVIETADPPWTWNLVLRGQRLLWSNPALHLIDLTTGAQKVLFDHPSPLFRHSAASPTLRGETAVWVTDDDLWAWTAGMAAPVRLALTRLQESSPALAGEWLIWAADGRLRAGRLAAALAAAPSRLALPAPRAAALANGRQAQPHGTDRYLFWHEQASGDQGSVASRGIYGVDLQTRQVITITGAANVTRQLLAVNDQWVMWAEQPPDPPPPYAWNYYATDRATGRSRLVATGDNPDAGSRRSALAGRTFVWSETTDMTTRLRLRDLPDGPVQELATLARPSGGVPTLPVVSADYVVWATVEEWQLDGRPMVLYAYDRRSRATREVARSLLTGTSNAAYTLDGARLLWTDNDLHLTDLRTHTHRLLYQGPGLEGIGALQLRGDVAIWTSYYAGSGKGNPGSSVLRGLRLSRPTPVEVMPGTRGLMGGATLAGEWIVWDWGGFGAYRGLDAVRIVDALGPPP